MITDLQVAEKLNMELPMDGTRNVQWVFKSVVLETDDAHVYLAAPIFRGREYPPRMAELIRFFYYRDTGLYSFDAKVCGRMLIGGASAWKLEPASEVKRTQRREYYRLTCMLAAQIRSIITGTVSRAHIPDGEVIIHDISGAGVRALSKRQFQVNEAVECDLYLYVETVTVTAKVLRCIHH